MSNLDEYKGLNTRKASVVQVGGFRPSRDPLASHFGLTPVALPGEAWPSAGPSLEEKPLLFVCQLNLTAAPFVPDRLKDVALVTFFIATDSKGLSRENGQTWLLRAYKSLDGLAPLPRPPEAPKVERGFECRWEVCDDQPVYDDPEKVIPPGFNDSRVHLNNVKRTKVGGYASNIQSEPWWGYDRHPADPRFCLQIDSELKVGLVWGDAGTIYLARGTAAGFEGQWFTDTQCY